MIKKSILNKIKKQKIKLEIVVPAEKGRYNSFWFHGDVAILTKGSRQISIDAMGEIGILFLNSNYNNNHYNDSAVEIARELRYTDKDIYNDKKVAWLDNNWFEFYLQYVPTKEEREKDLSNVVKYKDYVDTWLRLKKMTLKEYQAEIGGTGYYADGITDSLYNNAIETAIDLLNNDIYWENRQFITAESDEYLKETVSKIMENK